MNKRNNKYSKKLKKNNFREKKHNKTNKKRHLKKKYLGFGGKPKVNFPYVYYTLKQSELDQLPVLANYLTEKSNMCARVEIGEQRGGLNAWTENFKRSANERGFGSQSQQPPGYSFPQQPPGYSFPQQPPGYSFPQVAFPQQPPLQPPPPQRRTPQRRTPQRRRAQEYHAPPRVPLRLRAQERREQERREQQQEVPEEGREQQQEVPEEGREQQQEVPEEVHYLLLLKWDEIITMNAGIVDDATFFSNPENLEKILGHAKLITYPVQKTIGIFDVCMHYVGLPKDQQKVGYGKVLLTNIITFLDISVSKEHYPLIWLGIRENNVEFEKVAYLYASFGFEYPLMSNIMPNGVELEFNIMRLYKNRKIHISTQEQVNKIFNEIMNIWKQYNNDDFAREYKIYALNFKFDRATILSLRLFPFLEFDETKSIQMIRGEYLKQRETSGQFVTSKIELTPTHDDEYSIYLDTMIIGMENQSSYKFLIGEIGSVENCDGFRCFHTHPFANYAKWNVLIGTPSGQDMASFFATYAKCYKSKIQVPQFFGVTSIEGIYIVSFKPEGIIYINGILDKEDGITQINSDIQTISEQYEFPMSDREYDWSKYFMDETIEPGLVEKYLNDYSDYLSKINNLFNIDFLSWKNFTDESKFTVYYYKDDIKLHIQ
jgi:hypothetical protein